MGLRERLFRLAELEFRSAMRRIRTPMGSESPKPTMDLGSELPPRPRERSQPSAPPEIQRFYANLELPVGASVEEVKAAYRRLMRRYHPDRHASDPERAVLANNLAQQLRTAYEALLAYLAHPRGPNH